MSSPSVLRTDGGDPDRRLSPVEAAERFIARCEGRFTKNTVRSYRNRLQEFLVWTEAQGIDYIDELDGWLLDEYQRHLEAQDHARVTVKGKLSSLQQLLKYCVDVELVDEDLPDKVDIPKLTQEQETSDELLTAEDARDVLEAMRDSARHRGTAKHAILEVLWHVGCRISCLRSLDLGDWYAADRTLQFRHRPPTRLKDGTKHERNVLVSEEVADALNYWIERERPEKRDDNGRRPLFSTTHGRARRGRWRWRPLPMSDIDYDEVVVQTTTTFDVDPEEVDEELLREYYPDADYVKADNRQGDWIASAGNDPHNMVCPECGEGVWSGRSEDGQRYFRHHENEECPRDVSEVLGSSTGKSPSMSLGKRLVTLGLPVAFTAVVAWFVLDAMPSITVGGEPVVFEPSITTFWAPLTAFVGLMLMVALAPYLPGIAGRRAGR